MESINSHKGSSVIFGKYKVAQGKLSYFWARSSTEKLLPGSTFGPFFFFFFFKIESI